MGFPYRIVVEWSEEDSVFVARVPALAGCAAHGETEADAAAEARVAADAILDVMRESGRALPEAETSLPSGQIRLRLPRSLHADLARRAALEGVSLNHIMVMLLSSATTRAAAGPPRVEATLDRIDVALDSGLASAPAVFESATRAIVRARPETFAVREISAKGSKYEMLKQSKTKMKQGKRPPVTAPRRAKVSHAG